MAHSHVTFLYHYSQNSNICHHVVNHLPAELPIVGEHENHDITNSTISNTATGENDDHTTESLSILMRRNATHSMESNGLSNNHYIRFLERAHDFHAFHMGVIIDDCCHKNSGLDDSVSTRTTSKMMKLNSQVDMIRNTLPLDSKRPTVNRRFYHDAEDATTGRTTIVHDIEQIVHQTLIDACRVDKNTEGEANIDAAVVVEWFVYCNRYLRILEYDVVGEAKLGLPPHTDGIKICEQRQIKSTHTLLLYLTDCATGGETVIMDPRNHNWSKHRQVVVPPDRIYQTLDHHTNTNYSSGSTAFMNITHHGSCPSTNVALGISPQRGRIFLFPHAWPHAGAVVVNGPKIMLRAELTIQYRLDARV